MGNHSLGEVARDGIPEPVYAFLQVYAPQGASLPLPVGEFFGLPSEISGEEVCALLCAHQDGLQSVLDALQGLHGRQRRTSRP